MSKELNLKKIKEDIYWFELNNSGLRKLNGGDVKVLNIKIRKRERRVYADIILMRLEEEGYVTERHNNCYYSFDLLKLK